MHFLSKEDFIYINKKTVELHGGNFVPPNNFLKEESLDYLLEVINSSAFGKEMYPTLADKAAVYFFNTINNHIFQDGNKRTGLAAMQLFLRINGYRLNPILNNEALPLNHSNIHVLKREALKISVDSSRSNDILFHFAMATADGHFSLEECSIWINCNFLKIE